MKKHFVIRLLILILGLGAMGYGWWHLWGTDIPAERELSAQMEEWRTMNAIPYYLLNGGNGDDWCLEDSIYLDSLFEGMPIEWCSTFNNLPKIEELDSTFGILHVPSWAGRVRGEMPLRVGTEDHIIDFGAAGWYPETAKPGQVGNFALAAHRRTRGNSFRYTIELIPHEDVVVVELSDIWLKYEIISQEIIPADNDTALLPVPHDADAIPTQRFITMTTCGTATGGQWGNSHRIVTLGELVAWAPRV